jgi:carboxyl-terminal processing protease
MFPNLCLNTLLINDMKKIFIAIVALAAVCAMMLRAEQTEQLTPDQKLRIAHHIVSNYYVEDVDADTLVDEAIRAMLKTLDPHSAYSTPAETEELNQPLEGKFSGIGIQFSMVSDTVYVIQTTAGGPCEKVGVRPGDRIISANDTVIAGRKLVNKDILKTLRGPKGSRVVLKVKRAGEPDLIDFVVIRDDIPIYSVDAAYMADSITGYIRVSRFAEDTADELAKAMKKLRGKGMQNLIIDLSDNGGGYLGSAYKMAAEFLPNGAPIVSTKGLHQPAMTYSNDHNGSMLGGRLVVIVSQYSASASEILSGAIQDNDRGLIVGRRTFGKGLVQRPFPFPDGSMIRLTTARYYTPSGRCIQKHYDKGQGEEYQLDLLNRYNSGELWSADSIHIADSTRYETLRNHRTVYGGGGIIPDKFVPVDTSYYSAYYRDLVGKGVINQFCISYLDKNRDDILKNYVDEDAFADHFEVTDAITNALIERGKTEGVEYNEEQWLRSQPIIKCIIKGILSRDLYDDGSYYRHVNPLMPDYQAALRLINSPDEYNRLLSGKN